MPSPQTVRSALILAALSVLLPGALWSQAPDVVVTGGRLFDPTTGTSAAPGQLWIAGGRVLAHHDLDHEIPDGTQIVDASGCTLLPGLFDLHTHVAVAGGSMSAFVMLDPLENLRTQLQFGVTNVVDLHGDQRSIFELRERSRAAPDTARLYSAGAAFTVPGGHATQFGVEANTVTSLDEVTTRFEALLPHRPDVIKGILEHGGWAGIPTVPTLSDELFAAVAERAREAELPFFSHVWSLAEARTAVDLGADSLVHGVYLDEVDDELIRAMKANEVAYVPTLAVVIGSQEAAGDASPYAREAVSSALHPTLVEALAGGGATWSTGAELTDKEERFFGNLRRLADAGIVIGTGTDAGNPLTPHGPALLHELTLYVRAGLTPAQALRAATLDSARILRVDDDFGTLAAGKVADVVIVRGDPTADVADVWNTENVLKAGQLVDRTALVRRNAERRQSAIIRRAGEDVGVELDGFEDGDTAANWGGTWTVFTDSVAPNGSSTGELSVDDGVARLRGDVQEGFAWGAWAGVMITWDPDQKIVIDATGYEGLRVRLRGTERPYSLTVNRAAVKDFNVFSTQLEVTPEWSEVEIPFASLRQIGFGQPLDWEANDLTGLNIDARSAPMGPAVFGKFELEIDWIRLY